MTPFSCRNHCGFVVGVCLPHTSGFGSLIPAAVRCVIVPCDVQCFPFLCPKSPWIVLLPLLGYELRKIAISIFIFFSIWLKLDLTQALLCYAWGRDIKSISITMCLPLTLHPLHLVSWLLLSCIRFDPAQPMKANAWPIDGSFPRPLFQGSPGGYVSVQFSKRGRAAGETVVRAKNHDCFQIVYEMQTSLHIWHHHGGLNKMSEMIVLKTWCVSLCQCVSKRGEGCS